MTDCPGGQRRCVLLGAEYLLYGYGLVCLSMLVFNLLYSLHLRSGDRRLLARSDLLYRQVNVQLRRIEEVPDRTSYPVQARHLAWMRRRLSHVNYLLAFDQLMDELDRQDRTYQIYIGQLQPVFLYLATVYWKRENMQAAYYCHFLARHKLRRHMEMDQIQQVILSYLEKDSLYCKINALKALCSFGSPAVLADALQKLGRGQESQLHEKVITEALLTYTGDAEMLIECLWSRLERFSLQIQRAVLDYIRFQSGDYCGRMLKILQDPGRDKELRLAAIRYFGRYPYLPAREQLLAFLRDNDPTRWEFSAISASSLAGYAGQDVIDALLRAMNSTNWYIRSNAAASLEAHGLTYEEMLRVLSGDDRYAREMLAYRLKARQLEEEAAVAAAKAEEKTVQGKELVGV